MGAHRKGPSERRFAKVAVCIWDDPRVRSLELPTQHLYFRLVCGPETRRVPGLVVVNRHGLALGVFKWTLEEFDTRFQQLTDAGLATADWETGVVLLEHQLLEEFNSPPSLNTVKCWRRELANVPSCGLVERVHDLLRAQLGAKGNANWLRAFDGLAILARPRTPAANPSKLPSPGGRKPSSLASGILDPDLDPDPKPLTGFVAPAGSASAGEEDLPDYTELAQPVREHQPTAPAKRRAPSRAPAFPAQGHLRLTPAPNPEHCAFVMQRTSGGLFVHGPLVPCATETSLGGLLHPQIRAEWQRVLQEYFEPLNLTAEQIEKSLERLGRWIGAQGEAVTLQSLYKWGGERLHEMMALALAWDGQPRPQEPARAAARLARPHTTEARPSRPERSGDPAPLSALVAEHVLPRFQDAPPEALTPETIRYLESIKFDWQSALKRRAAAQ